MLSTLQNLSLWNTEQLSYVVCYSHNLKALYSKEFTTISVIGLLKLKKQKHTFVKIADILLSNYEYSKGTGIFFLIGTYSMQDWPAIATNGKNGIKRK